jgi:hypothetical protein
VFAYARAEGVELRLDATGIQVRRPAAGRGGRRAFVSGKKKQNTMKATVIADHQGRTILSSLVFHGQHDVVCHQTRTPSQPRAARLTAARRNGPSRRATG